MSIQEIIYLVSLVVVILGAIFTILFAIKKGELQKYIEEKMIEAENLFANLEKPEKSWKKLEYVLNAVKEKYKIMALLVNVKMFVLKIIKLSKKLNAK